MTDYIRPFGPTIYRAEMDSEELAIFTRCAEYSLEEPQPHGQQLAGNIAKQYQAKFEDKEKFMSFVHKHVSAFTKYEMERANELLINPVNTDVDWKQMYFSLHTGPWINYQEANEFNPIHSHNGTLSAVIYIDVPKEIQEEANDGLPTNMRCPGQIEFLYGSDVVGSSGTHKIIPKTGDILLFHAGLKHQVYPFKSNVTRVSMSFNVFDIRYGREVKDD